MFDSINVIPAPPPGFGPNVVLLIYAGILRLFQSSLLEFVAIEDMGQFLGNLPSTMDSDLLFMHIDSVHFNEKRFWQILAQEQQRPNRDSHS